MKTRGKTAKEWVETQKEIKEALSKLSDKLQATQSSVKADLSEIEKLSDKLQVSVKADLSEIENSLSAIKNLSTSMIIPGDEIDLQEPASHTTVKETVTPSIASSTTPTVRDSSDEPATTGST